MRYMVKKKKEKKKQKTDFCKVIIRERWLLSCGGLVFLTRWGSCHWLMSELKLRLKQFFCKLWVPFSCIYLQRPDLMLPSDTVTFRRNHSQYFNNRKVGVVHSIFYCFETNDGTFPRRPLRSEHICICLHSLHSMKPLITSLVATCDGYETNGKWGCYV